MHNTSRVSHVQLLELFVLGALFQLATISNKFAAHQLGRPRAVCQYNVSWQTMSFMQNGGSRIGHEDVRPLDQSEDDFIHTIVHQILSQKLSTSTLQSAHVEVSPACGLLDSLPHTRKYLALIVLADMYASYNPEWRTETLVQIRHEMGSWAATHFKSSDLETALQHSFRRYIAWRQRAGRPLNAATLTVGNNWWHGFGWQTAKMHASWNVSHFWSKCSVEMIHGCGHGTLFASLMLHRGIHLPPCTILKHTFFSVPELRTAERLCVGNSIHSEAMCFDGLYHVLLTKSSEDYFDPSSGFDLCQRAVAGVACFVRYFASHTKFYNAQHESMRCLDPHVSQTQASCIFAASWTMFAAFDKSWHMVATNSTSLSGCYLERMVYEASNHILARDFLEDVDVSLPSMSSWCQRYPGDMAFACILGASSLISMYAADTYNGEESCEQFLLPHLVDIGDKERRGSVVTVLALGDDMQVNALHICRQTRKAGPLFLFFMYQCTNMHMTCSASRGMDTVDEQQSLLLNDVLSKDKLISPK